VQSQPQDERGIERAHGNPRQQREQQEPRRVLGRAFAQPREHDAQRADQRTHREVDAAGQHDQRLPQTDQAHRHRLLEQVGEVAACREGLVHHHAHGHQRQRQTDDDEMGAVQALQGGVHRVVFRVMQPAPRRLRPAPPGS
jgi:hypothetical protein